MKTTNEILADADAALAAAQEGELRVRLDAMTRLMASFERLAREVAKGTVTWAEARPWAMRSADRLRAARETLSKWDLETGRIFYDGDEEAAERALARRSQFELVRELFRGTPAEELLAGYDAEDVDEDFRDRADRLALDPPEWVPRSHTWWRWRDE